MLSPFSQPLYSAVLNEKSNSLLPSYTLLENRNLLYCCITVQYKEKNTGFFCSELRCIEFNVQCTNFSINSYEGQNCELYRTGPDQLYPRAFALRPNWVLLVLAIFKRVMDEKIFALRLRTSAT